MRHALACCLAGDAPFWTTCLVPSIEHPAWWPRGGAPGKPGSAVAAYDTLIVGAGASGIGMHRE